MEKLNNYRPLNLWYSNPLLWFHVMTHLSVVAMFAYGAMQHWITAIVMFYMFGCWGVAITFHRLVSHKSFNCPVWFKNVGLILGSLGGVGSSIQWTAVHRDHHRHTDTVTDPHNPAGGWRRFLQMQFLTMLVPSSVRYVPDLLRDPLHQKLHKYYWAIHAAYLILLLLIDPFAVVYAYLFPCFLLWHTMASLGTFAHTPGLGFRTHNQADHSTNLWFLGFFAFGEGWHNNHHHQASNYRFGQTWKQFDLSAYIIEAIRIK